MRWHIKTLKATPHHPSDASHSHFQHLLANLHLFIHSRVFEELYTEIALPQGGVALHAVTWAAHKQHLHAALTSGSGDREYHQLRAISPEVNLTGSLLWKSMSVCAGHKTVLLRRAKLWFLFPVSASYRQGQQLIIGDMNGSSKCSKEQGAMIGRANGMPLTLREEEISLTPHRQSSCIGKHLLHCYFNRPQPFHNVALNDKIQITRFA